MSSTGSIITAFGKGTIWITFYDNLQNPVDKQAVYGVKNGAYKWSVNPIRTGISKYAFSVENKGFLSLEVDFEGNNHDLTAGANTIVFDFWNRKTYTPSKTDAPQDQHLGGVALLSQP
ncbi:hypothetical protein BGZ97_008955 [Linnemannia gamsii]|jgi:hypothetical protein|uniref:Uncharacterized protein n=1 Tax=Linnemannia gamsii TaxID=64522 RepID=A0A9P6QLH1_9FUNG|nr:hypothetical protein BGZ97_008955 [Linnemannia gamsii]